jgi:hypothetical protein
MRKVWDNLNLKNSARITYVSKLVLNYVRSSGTNKTRPNFTSGIRNPLGNSAYLHGTFLP